MIITAIFALASCKKEDSIKDSIMAPDINTGNSSKSSMANELLVLYQQLPTPNFGNITLVNRDILKFESAAHYENVYELLLAQYEAWTNLFLQTYNTGDEDALDEIIENLNFDDQWPLRMFERKYKKTSTTLFEAMTFKEEAWLEAGARGRSPSDEITDCPVEQALLSLFHEFCIGDTVCQIRPDGYAILIPRPAFSFINEIRHTPISALLSREPTVPGNELPPGWIPITSPPVILVTPTDEEGCYESYFSNSGWQPNGDNHKFEWTFKHRWTTSGSFNGGKTTNKATMKNYKWKNGKWKKDFGSFCKITFNTQLYNTIMYDCLKTERLSNSNQYILKLSSRSIGKTVASMWWGDLCDLNDSYLICRHKGIDFKINVKTGDLIN